MRRSPIQCPISAVRPSLGLTPYAGLFVAKETGTLVVNVKISLLVVAMETSSVFLVSVVKETLSNVGETGVVVIETLSPWQLKSSDFKSSDSLSFGTSDEERTCSKASLPSASVSSVFMTSSSSSRNRLPLATAKESKSFNSLVRVSGSVDVSLASFRTRYFSCAPQRLPAAEMGNWLPVNYNTLL